jgi:hypothetical protein
MEKTRKAERRTVTLYPQDWATIERADTNSAGISATLRRIIREWDRRQRTQATRPDAGAGTA